MLQLSLTLLSTIIIDRRGDGATHQRRPHANQTYGSGVIAFFIMLLASVLIVFMDGQCKPGFNVTAHVLLETEHYLAENFIFDDRQHE